ncbi:hypothetical protein CRUP_035074 [Coryphaenoides rupestris]|nr:hypothetical protein CRUP_035074 [Coryphaenoides rupestris]
MPSKPLLLGETPMVVVPDARTPEEPRDFSPPTPPPPLHGERGGAHTMDLKESCGSDASGESSSLRPATGATSWQAFARGSTLHGLRFLVPHGVGGQRPATVRRLLWAAALLACVGLLALESGERLAYFLSYPHVTSVDAVATGSLVFPAVTVCNLNAYRFGRLTRNDLYHAGELLALLDVHLAVPQPALAEPEVLASLLERANFTAAYRPRAFSMREFTERVGHDLREMMLYCRYQGQPCSHRDFKTLAAVAVAVAAATSLLLPALSSSSGGEGWRSAAVVH